MPVLTFPALVSLVVRLVQVPALVTVTDALRGGSARGCLPALRGVPAWSCDARIRRQGRFGLACDCFAPGHRIHMDQVTVAGMLDCLTQ